MDVSAVWGVGGFCTEAEASVDDEIVGHPGGRVDVSSSGQVEE